MGGTILNISQLLITIIILAFAITPFFGKVTKRQQNKYEFGNYVVTKTGKRGRIAQVWPDDKKAPCLVHRYTIKFEEGYMLFCHEDLE